MNKGFTLIEMIVVMTLFIVIALISVPLISGMIKKGNDEKYEVFLHDVFLATEAYIEKNLDDYPELKNTGGVGYVYMSELVEEDYIDSNLINPKYCVNNNCTSKRVITCENDSCAVDNYTIIVTKQDNGTYSYELRNEIVG